MKATIWAPSVTLPTGYCFNCGAPAGQAVVVHNEAGMGSSSSHGFIGLAMHVARDAAASAGGWPVPLCERCLPRARPSVWEDLPLFLVRWRMLPGQTAVGRAFRVLNAGKDLLRGNTPFIRLQVSNPRVLADIRTLNPGTRIT
ncbi:MAG: hypothetical protein U0133_17540 [Gemmatimonadales bacterium]